MGSCKLILPKQNIITYCVFFLGSPEDDDKHFLERLGVSSDASDMASMVSRSSVKYVSNLKSFFVGQYFSLSSPSWLSSGEQEQ